MRFRLIKRDGLPKKKETVIRVAAILLSLICSGIILLAFKLDPIAIFKAIAEGALGTDVRVAQTVVKTIPLLITSLGIIVAFKMKFWNIGGEGQITMGALAATWIALNLSDGLPAPLKLIIMGIAAVTAGGIWALIPAVFKAKMGTNETIFTLMMNYIAINFVTYLQYGPWMDKSAGGFPKIAPFPENAILPSTFGVNIGWIIALIAVAFMYVFMNYTKKGYEIGVVGESIETARYAGMNIKKIIVAAMFISGGICGLVGMIQAAAIEKTLVAGIANGYGFTAIITAWLSRLNPITAIFVCFAFAMLLQGGAYIQIAMNVPAAVAQIVQGTVLFFVLGSEFFLQYKPVFAQNKKMEVA